MKHKDLGCFIMLIIKCFTILLVLGIFLPKAIEYLLQNLIENTKTYKNSIFVYKLVDKNYKLVYNYILTFYLFFKV